MDKLIKKILIIDDDPATRDAVRLAVNEVDFMEFIVTESSTVSSGIKQLEKTKPDVIILDIHLQDNSGFDFIDIMHKDKHLKNTKIIMLSADDSLKNIFIAENKGIDAFYFLGKPFNISDLQALVLSVCLPPKLQKR